MNIAFDNPVYLWYLASLPLLIITHFLSLRMAKRKAVSFANFKTLKRIAGQKLITKNTNILLIRLFVISLFILAAAGAKIWYETEMTDNNYVIAIDVSSSMSAKDVAPTRLEAAKSYALRFIDGIEAKNKIGVVTFSGVTIIEQTLNEDKAFSRAAIEDIQIAKAGGTDVPGAIITATNLLLADPDKGRVIIMLTDGSSTLGNFIDNSITKALEYAVANHVIIHAIGIGSESGPIGYLPEYYDIPATYNEKTLSVLTNTTGGVKIDAYTTADVESSYGILQGAKNLTITSFDLDYYLLIAGLLLLFIEWGLVNTTFRRIA